uniref:Ion_trans domain-containing protein n=1 Tax=Macrostomum lignano TaxID=282301 RepID=A0A1I8JKJ6_9PLAT
MGWKLRKRDDVEPILPLKKCFCFDNRMGTFVGCIIITITALVEAITVFLDWLTYDENLKFEIHGAFRSFWKRLFWKGFAICDGIMTLSHVIIIALCIFTIVAILRPNKFKIYDLLPTLRVLYVTMILYILIELGISCYVFSWYGLAGWRLPFLVWRNMFYLIRFFCNVGFCIVFYSYACEISQELANPEAKDPNEAGGIALGFQYQGVPILFLSGICFVIGLERTFHFFFKLEKLKGTAFFFGGILIVLFVSPILGMLLEFYGFFVLFSGFFPVVLNFMSRVPVIGPFLCQLLAWESA